MSVRADIINNLISEIDEIRTSASYEAEIKKVVPYHINILTEMAASTPLLMVVDEGDETLLAMDGTHEAFAFHINIIGYINKGTKYETTQEDLNAITASVKKWINAVPSLGDNVYEIQYVEGTGNSYDDQGKALTGIRARILYWCAKGTY